MSQQLNAIFVAPKLQLQNRTCKPLCDFGAIFAIYRRGMRYNSRNRVTLSSIGVYKNYVLSNWFLIRKFLAKGSEALLSVPSFERPVILRVK